MAIDDNNRQLAVVMFTDIVGYTALMQEDEQKAKRDRDRHRDILERLIEAHLGTLVQYFGDGTLSAFGSAIQAIRCALAIQKELRRAPEIPVRIGLHLGDIVYESSGVYGDAVNVASRIEAIAGPGTVLFSDKLYDDIKNHPEFSMMSLGHYHFKNVKRPIEIFALTNPPLRVPTVGELKNKLPRPIKSVAVLPFTNMSSDPENDYFSDGISEELINAFAQVDGLDVTARTSAFGFKGKNLDVREIGSQLGVDTILEGSVRKAGNRVRVTAQLINTADGYHLFSEIFDRDLDDIFAVQDEIAQKITQKLTGKLKGFDDNKPMVKTLTTNIDAYNVYLKGIFHWNKWTPESIKKSIALFEEALALAPDFASAYSWLSSAYTILGARGNVLPEIAYPKAKEYAVKALELDDELYNSHLAMGHVLLFYEWNWEKAERSIKRALELNPGSGRAHNVYAMYFQAVGKPEEALAQAEQAVRLDPLSLLFNYHLAFVLMYAERYDESLSQLDKILDMDSAYRAALELKGWIYIAREEYHLAIETLKVYHAMTGSENKGLTALGVAYARAERREEAQACLDKMERRNLQDTQEVIDTELFVLNAVLGHDETALYLLEKTISGHAGSLFFLKSNPALKSIRSDPRYVDLMKKSGLHSIA